MNETENKNREALKKISKDRERTNLLKKWEQQLLAYLVQRIPSWVTSNMLTAIGFCGSIITFLSFILATYVNLNWLLLGVVGFFINWFGDSTDGRIAYYRGIPRKWYGFSLDIIVDWWTDILIGCGYIIYVGGIWKWAGFGFIVLYGWSIIMALLRYKITKEYVIDSGFMGPTEVRLLISLFLVIEVLHPGTLKYLGVLTCVVLLIVNLKEMRNLLYHGDERDARERKKKEKLAKKQNEGEAN